MQIKQAIQVKIFDANYNNTQASDNLTDQINQYLSQIDNLMEFDIEIQANQIAKNATKPYDGQNKEIIIVVLKRRH